MGDATVVNHGTDDASDLSDGTEYKYAFGLINKNEDPDIGPNDIIVGGDIRLQLNGWFPQKVTREAEEPHPSDAVFFIKPQTNGQSEINNLNPAKLESGPFDSVEFGIGVGVGPFSVGVAKWDIGYTSPTVEENYNGETDHTYWEESTNDWPTSQDSAIGATCDFEADESLSNGDTLEVYAKSNFTYHYTPYLSGAPTYVTTDDITFTEEFNVIED
ncbi:hypothetical protein [Haloferax volcanii]|uniref:hypothetical protein n=1 Tax=Haloferax volcanii TaxID=2246 RepID=UPI00385AE71B